MATGLALRLGGTGHTTWPYFEGHEPPANVPPVAAFTSSRVYRTVSFNGSSSSDSDGTIASYAWDFGDGTTGTGATPTHTYATAGTYSVTLTVTDNAGGTSSVTHSVTVLPLYSDSFNRADNLASLGSTDGGTQAATAWSILTSDSSTWGVAANRAAPRSGAATSVASIDPGVTSGRVRVTYPIMIPSGTTGRTIGPVFRCQDLTNFWFLSGRQNNTEKWGLVRKVAGTNTYITPDVTVAPANGDVAEVLFTPTTIQAYVNGVLISTSALTQLGTATKVGMLGNFTDTVSRNDSFEFWAD